VNTEGILSGTESVPVHDVAVVSQASDVNNQKVANVQWRLHKGAVRGYLSRDPSVEAIIAILTGMPIGWSRDAINWMEI
jgi:hypothetical protein